MPAVSRKGDRAGGHGCFPPTPAVMASTNVNVEGKAALRKGDMVAPHACGNCPPHPRSVSAGSSNVYVNGKPLARKGDAIGCGGSVSGAAGTVFANG